MTAEVALPVAALAVSVLSLYVSGRVAWHNSFRPAKIVGAFPHLVVWTLSSYKGDRPTGDIASRYITPSFWLSNTGAREALIEDIRLSFEPSVGADFFAYPVSKVPIEAVESPTLFHEYDRLGLGGPFNGFCLTRDEVWICCFAFATKMQNYERLKDSVRTDVQVCYGRKRRWVTVLSDRLEFGSNPIHLQGLNHGSVAAGAMINHVFSTSWNSRREG